MSVQACRAAPGPGGGQAARVLAGMLGDPLAGYVRLAATYSDAVRVPFTPCRTVFLLSRPGHAEHVLAGNQDNYVKAFTCRPLRALAGNGLLTSGGEVWRRHRRLIQPVLSRIPADRQVRTASAGWAARSTPGRPGEVQLPSYRPVVLKLPS